MRLGGWPVTQGFPVKTLSFYKDEDIGGPRWFRTNLSALRRMMPGDYKYEASLGYLVSGSKLAGDTY